MKHYDYKRQTFPNNDLIDGLNVLGCEGWELVQMRSLVFEKKDSSGWVVGVEEFVECMMKRDLGEKKLEVYLLPSPSSL